MILLFYFINKIKTYSYLQANPQSKFWNNGYQTLNSGHLYRGKNWGSSGRETSDYIVYNSILSGFVFYYIHMFSVNQNIKI